MVQPSKNGPHLGAPGALNEPSNRQDPKPLQLLTNQAYIEDMTRCPYRKLNPDVLVVQSAHSKFI
jgi:hypothetical protein